MILSNVISLMYIGFCLRKTKTIVTEMGYLQILSSNDLSKEIHCHNTLTQGKDTRFELALPSRLPSPLLIYNVVL